MSTSRGLNGGTQERLVSSRTSTLWRLPSPSWWDPPQICSRVLHIHSSLQVALPFEEVLSWATFSSKSVSSQLGLLCTAEVHVALCN